MRRKSTPLPLGSRMNYISESTTGATLSARKIVPTIPGVTVGTVLARKYAMTDVANPTAGDGKI